jgi:hypothetical protein
MKEAEAELDLVSIYVIGPDEGPVRIGVSRDPDERFRVARVNCVLESKLQFRDSLQGSEKAHEIVDAIIKGCEARGLHIKADWVQLSAKTAIETIRRTAKMFGVKLLSPDQSTMLVKTQVEAALGKVVPMNLFKDLRNRTGQRGC